MFSILSPIKNNSGALTIGLMFVALDDPGTDKIEKIVRCVLFSALSVAIKKTALFVYPHLKKAITHVTPSLSKFFVAAYIPLCIMASLASLYIIIVLRKKELKSL